ncbi:unnamed protein product [Rotaria sp. Silwood2]|nr:unnamed protein product [Rotaria sp. Silwood2]CAF2682535.1 unnamed protein product [Rotaria sp. Silwood2]CAF2921672.1 unnamed protein product [Rotaria sp. Silwood2]CAF3041571.1 unnamed protein product [Rotaria sp. Silwood2]CAF4112396.1 unnamed protein product [Rotaria sp. Silwood2]
MSSHMISIGFRTLVASVITSIFSLTMETLNHGKEQIFYEYRNRILHYYNIDESELRRKPRQAINPLAIAAVYKDHGLYQRLKLTQSIVVHIFWINLRRNKHQTAEVYDTIIKRWYILES